MPRNISPRRTLAPPPLYVPLPDAVGIKDPAVASTLNAVIKQLNAVANYVRQQTTAPQLPPPTGPTAPAVTQGAGSTHVVQFYADASGPNVTLYRVWRAVAGTRNSPTDPGPDSATCIATIVPSRIEDGSLHRHLEREFSVTDMDPANPSRFKYWVTSIDDRGIESAFVEASGGPIETQTNGPGDQSPEQTVNQLNKLLNTTGVNNGAGATTIDQPYAITASTNATPIVVTIGTHAFAVNDWVAIDGHATNTNANGWWRVSAIAATTITLNGSIGNGAGGATGKAYRVDKTRWGWAPPTNPEYLTLTNGASGAYLRPNIYDGAGGVQDTLCHYIPWYSEQATLAEADNSSSLWRLPAPAAGAQVSISQEVGFRKFNQTASLCFSVYAYWTGVSLPTDSSMKLEVLWDDGTAIASTSWTQADITNSAGGGARRYVFNFRLSSGAGGKNRLKFRISNVCTSGTGVGLFFAGPMVNVGDAAAPFTSVVDVTDAHFPALLTAPWKRPVTQYLKRDSSAPYV